MSPTTKRDPCKLGFKHLIMSHRGGSLERMENTMAAFKHSVHTLNVDLLEFDVCETKGLMIHTLLSSHVILPSFS
jgi:hypothetical protein